MTDKRGETLNKMLGLDNAADLLDKGIGELVAELNKRNIEHKSVDKPADAPADSEVVADAQKTFGKLVLALMDSQAELMERQDAVESGVATSGKSLTDENAALKEQVKALTERVETLSVQLDQRSRSASRATETELEDKDLTQDLKNLNTRIDPIWGRIKE